MADVKEMRIFCAEQIEVPDALPEILKNYSKLYQRNVQEKNLNLNGIFLKNINDFSKKIQNKIILLFQ